MILQQNKRKGFVALITAIVLSLVLIVVTVTLNRSSFLTRSAILEAEYKEMSSALAEACADIALLKLAVSSTYTNDEVIDVNENQCLIKPILDNSPISGQKTIETRAIYKESVTNLRIVVNASDISVVLWSEVVY